MTKFVIIVPDGAADEPLEQLDNQTALEAAHIPHMDAISRQGRQGMVQTGERANGHKLVLCGYRCRQASQEKTPKSRL